LNRRFHIKGWPSIGTRIGWAGSIKATKTTVLRFKCTRNKTSFNPLLLFSHSGFKNIFILNGKTELFFISNGKNAVPSCAIHLKKARIMGFAFSSQIIRGMFPAV